MNSVNTQVSQWHFACCPFTVEFAWPSVPPSGLFFVGSFVHFLNNPLFQKSCRAVWCYHHFRDLIACMQSERRWSWYPCSPAGVCICAHCFKCSPVCSVLFLLEGACFRAHCSEELIFKSFSGRSSHAVQKTQWGVQGLGQEPI